METCQPWAEPSDPARPLLSSSLPQKTGDKESTNRHCCLVLSPAKHWNFHKFLSHVPYLSWLLTLPVRHFCRDNNDYAFVGCIWVRSTLPGNKGGFCLTGMERTHVRKAVSSWPVVITDFGDYWLLHNQETLAYVPSYSQPLFGPQEQQLRWRFLAGTWGFLGALKPVGFIPGGIETLLRIRLRPVILRYYSQIYPHCNLNSDSPGLAERGSTALHGMSWMLGQERNGQGWRGCRTKERGFHKSSQCTFWFKSELEFGHRDHKEKIPVQWAKVDLGIIRLPCPYIPWGWPKSAPGPFFRFDNSKNHNVVLLNEFDNTSSTSRTEFPFIRPKFCDAETVFGL